MRLCPNISLSTFRIKRQLEELKRLWTDRQRQLKKHMIFATIKIVKSWDMDQFRALGRAQREAIMKAVNEDAEKLIAEYGPGARDPDLVRLREEIKLCNRIFNDLSNKVNDGGKDSVNL